MRCIALTAAALFLTLAPAKSQNLDVPVPVLDDQGALDAPGAVSWPSCILIRQL